MQKLGKTFALLLVLVFIGSFVIVSSLIGAQAQDSSKPEISWEKQYGARIYQVSNLIETSDGGFAFLDRGWSFQSNFVPSTLYKVDSVGNVQWTKTLDSFTASNIIQTSDGGYEIAGHAGNTFNDQPNSVIKTDSTGNITWSADFSNLIPFQTSPMPPRRFLQRMEDSPMQNQAS